MGGREGGREGRAVNCNWGATSTAEVRGLGGTGLLGLGGTGLLGSSAGCVGGWGAGYLKVKGKFRICLISGSKIQMYSTAIR